MCPAAKLVIKARIMATLLKTVTQSYGTYSGNGGHHLQYGYLCVGQFSFEIRRKTECIPWMKIMTGANEPLFAANAVVISLTIVCIAVNAGQK